MSKFFFSAVFVFFCFVMGNIATEVCRAGTITPSAVGNELDVDFSCDEIYQLTCSFTDVEPNPFCSVWVKEESRVNTILVINKNIKKTVHFRIQGAPVASQYLLQPLSSSIFVVEHSVAQLIHGKLCPGVRTRMTHHDYENEKSTRLPFF